MPAHDDETASPPLRARNAVRVAAALILLLIALAAIRLGLRPAPGLNGEYVAGGDMAGTPSRVVVDAELSTLQIGRRWPPIAPPVFRIRWYGYLALDRTDTYTFEITADDGAALSIDGTTIIDIGTGRGLFTQRAATRLEPGLHAIVVDYRQAGGDYAFAWTWSRGGGSMGPVPAWRLLPRRGAWPAQRAARWLDLAIVVVVVLLALWTSVTARVRLAGAVRRRPAAALLVLFVAMAVAQTWPLASDPAHLSRNDNADTVLNEWALAWVAHQAVRDPLHLFDANIFHPERYTLAYSESMIVQAAAAAPLFWAGLPPVLVYNLLVIAGFALNGWVMALVMRRWTGDTYAAVVAGILFAFNSNILTRLPHMQALHVEFLPLALWAWDRLLQAPRLRHAAFFGAMVALQSLTSVYLLVFTFSAVLAAALARVREWTGRRARQIVPLVLFAAGVAAVMTLPFLLPYLWTNEQQGFERSLEDAASLSATLGSYLASPSRLHYSLWSYRWFDSPSALFPGVTAVVLGAVAIARGVAVRDRRARLGLAVLVAGVLLSLGPKVPGYVTLFTYVPMFRVVRVVSSFGYLALVGLAIVAGFGAREVRTLLPARAWRMAAPAVLVLVFVEPLASPLELVRVGPVPHIYELIRDQPDAVVVELPFYTTAAGFQQAQYMLNSTRHWKPMLNGYSGFRPASYYRSAEALAAFPSPASIDWLRRRGVSHVFVHLDAFDDGLPERLATTPGVQRVASDRGVTLYRLDQR